MMPAGVRPDGQGAWYLEQWRHDRDQARIQREFWPFRWGVPTAQWGPDAPRHPLDSPGPALPPAVIARRRRAAQLLGRHQLPDRYAAQASLYASTVSPPPQATSPAAEPTLTAGAATGDPVADVGYAFHRLMEALGARRRDPEDFQRHYLGEG